MPLARAMATEAEDVAVSEPQSEGTTAQEGIEVCKVKLCTISLPYSMAGESDTYFALLSFYSLTFRCWHAQRSHRLVQRRDPEAHGHFHRLLPRHMVTLLQGE